MSEIEGIIQDYISAWNNSSIARFKLIKLADRAIS